MEATVFPGIGLRDLPFMDEEGESVPHYGSRVRISERRLRKDKRIQMARTVKMTEGNIPKQLLSYALPLVLGNLFQLTYNAVDSMIVGRFIGKDTLAAVGTAGPVMSIFILGISGISMGA